MGFLLEKMVFIVFVIVAIKSHINNAEAIYDQEWGSIRKTEPSLLLANLALFKTITFLDQQLTSGSNVL